MDAAAQGKKALDASNYEQAITEYTAALKSSPTSPIYLIQRATAYQRAKKYPEALTDANNAVINAQKRAKRELIVEAQFRRGCALHSLERYGDAAFVLGIVKKMNDKHNAAATWVRKNEMAMDKLDEEDERRKCSVKETPEESQEVKEEPMEQKLTRASNGTASTNGAAATSAPASAAAQQTPPDRIRHEWYQNNENVYFTLLAKGVPKDKAQIDIQERSLSISFPLTTGSSYDLTLEPLFGAVKPDECVPRIMATKVEVVLVKATPGQKWSALESSEADTQSTTSTTISASSVQQTTSSATKGPAYPSSSRSGPKDWDKVASSSLRSTNTKSNDREDSKSSLEDDDDYEGGDEANHFFKKLFKGASPDAQRAMMKSYTESNGTSLSTNWEEVGKGKVETVPPDGMEAKEWSKSG